MSWGKTMTTGSSLSAEHQTFIDDITKLIDVAKEKLTTKFQNDFDLESVLNDPEFAKELMADIQLELVDYLKDAEKIGNTFGQVKEEDFNARS